MPKQLPDIQLQPGQIVRVVGKPPLVLHYDKARTYATVTASGTYVDPIPPLPVTTNPSGIPMPTSEPTGFRRVFADDFTTPVPEGQFPAATNGRWAAYLLGWHNSGGTGTYDPGIISVHDSTLDMHIHTTADGVPRIANPSPIWVPQAQSESGTNQLYGRYSACFKADILPGYKTAWLLWPQSENWPHDGEIDFPEGSLDSTISAFMHRMNGTSGGDQDAYPTTARYGVWRVVTIEWTPTRCEFFLDGVSIGKSTARIPSTPMRWQLQTETDLVPTKPPVSSDGHVLVDWLTVAAYAP